MTVRLPLSRAHPHHKSGLLDLCKIKHNPGKPELCGGGSDTDSRLGHRVSSRSDPA
jgi:hypothetical protein